MVTRGDLVEKAGLFYLYCCLVRSRRALEDISDTEYLPTVTTSTNEFVETRTLLLTHGITATSVLLVLQIETECQLSFLMNGEARCPICHQTR